VKRGASQRDFDAGREERITRSEEELSIDKRMVESGEVDIRKHVETEHVRRPVTRKREDVDIERHAVRGREHAGRIGEDEEIRVPLREEEVVVEKHPVVKEELVVRRRTVEEEVDVEADLRKEKIDVDRHEARKGSERTERMRGDFDKLRERGRDEVDKLRERGREGIDKLKDRNKRDLP
jgi:uncharacterized protein (TIGR02271 family)